MKSMRMPLRTLRAVGTLAFSLWAACGIVETTEVGVFQADAAVTFFEVQALSACGQLLDDAGIERVAVLSDRNLVLRVVARPGMIEEGQLRASVEPRWEGAKAVTLALSRGANDRWEGTATVTVPTDGEHTFVVRLAGEELTTRVQVSSVEPNVSVVVDGATGGLYPITVTASCGESGAPIREQAVTVTALPAMDFLPAAGLKTDRQGRATFTARLAKDSQLPARVEVTVGNGRDGCTIETDAGCP